MDEYRLFVEYPFRGSLEHDEKIKKAVGEPSIGSGAGMGFRDMEWIYEGEGAKQAAEAALERVKALDIDGMTAKIWKEEEE